MIMITSQERAPPHEDVAFIRLKRVIHDKFRQLRKFVESHVGCSYFPLIALCKNKYKRKIIKHSCMRPNVYWGCSHLCGAGWRPAGGSGRCQAAALWDQREVRPPPHPAGTEQSQHSSVLKAERERDYVLFTACSILSMHAYILKYDNLENALPWS